MQIVLEVCHFKFLFMVGFIMCQRFRVTTSEDKIINIKKKNYEMDSYFIGIDIRARLTSRKSCVKKKVVHFGIPRLRIFLKTIKRFLKVKNKVGVILDTVRRFFHIDFFLQIPMQEDGFNIHMMHLPFM
jgi:hypothetical protein